MNIHWSNWLSTLWGGGNQGCTRLPSSHQCREIFGAPFSKPASDTGAGKPILRWKMREIKSTRALKKLARNPNHKRVSAPSKSFHVGAIGTEYFNSRALLVIGFKEPQSRSLIKRQISLRDFKLFNDGGDQAWIKTQEAKDLFNTMKSHEPRKTSRSLS